ncbi:MAG TPA: 4-(cytidine 5'-diphospho)-2-C-methyl-D-erythritol kinase, partial [Candidatus Gracilibacteria bacterium]|nr:4-(cytidine 5'-diphospho)-2-C-methyl-D-erythritol kinase [Candidatus Gracilibacteria bacterium]
MKTRSKKNRPAVTHTAPVAPVVKRVALRVRSFAKINLTLDVLKKEGNYHQIRTVFQEIPLHDELIFAINPDGKPGSVDLHCSRRDVPVDETNMVYRAVELLKKNARADFPSLTITIKKNIPVAAGLGGGSSNAAATLGALNTWLKLELSKSRLQKMAERIGMDVPFFLHGGTALGTHFGEKIKSLPGLKFPHLLIAMNGKKESTKSVYARLNANLVGRNAAKTTALLTYLKKKSPATRIDIQKLSGFLHNDFETAFRTNKSKSALGIPDLKKILLRTGAASVHICGSGPALYAVYPNRKTRDMAYRQLKVQNLVFLKSLS